MRRASLVVALSALASILAGCSLAPPYAPPPITTPTAFKEIGPWTPASPDDAKARGNWWSVYNDPTLDGLEQRIEKGNPDLAVALARYDEARALASQARAALVPEVDANGGSTTIHQSDHRPLRVGGPNNYDDDIAGGSTSYELDLWGRVRNMVAASKDQAQASAADLASVRLSLEAQLADAYVNLRGLDAQAKLLTNTTNAYARALKLTQALHNGGAAPGLDVDRAQTQLQTARAQRIDIDAQRALLEHEIATLVGETASTFSLPQVALLPDPPHTPVAAPSLLLQRRPDIDAAERRAAAANAGIGVARAAFYPDITLNAAGGFESAGGISLLQVANSWWTLGPSVSLPIFDGGRRKAQLRQAKDQFDEASATYRSTVLSAFQQVEDELVALRVLEQEAEVRDETAKSAHLAVTLTLNEYKAGTVDYTSVVTAQATALSADQSMLTVLQERQIASVTLIEALGGGWTDADLPKR